MTGRKWKTVIVRVVVLILQRLVPILRMLNWTVVISEHYISFCNPRPLN